jgi:hypothetical protein
MNPPIDPQIATLIEQMAHDDPTWGHSRIRGELLGSGHRVAAATVRRVLRRAASRPRPFGTTPPPGASSYASRKRSSVPFSHSDAPVAR